MTLNDPKLAGKPIVRHTYCRVGGHAFTWTAANLSDTLVRPHESLWDDLRCSCGAYSWREWQEATS